VSSTSTSPGGFSIPIGDELSPSELDSAREFHAEVTELFRSLWTDKWLTLDQESEVYLAEARRVAGELVRRGWYTLHLPVEFGGQDDMVRYAILRELEGYYRVPPSGGHARFVVAPALAKFGTPEQQSTYLPRIANGELVICEGFTEPDSGSDIGSMRTRAVLDGDHYVVNGSKIYVTYGPYANMMILAAITDPDAPKYKNMSLFLVDMTEPGIVTSPLVCLTGHEISEVHIKDLRIPRTQLVGTENQGFYHLATALNFERSGVNRPAKYMAHLEDVVTEARRRGLWSDGTVRRRIGALAADIDAWRDVSWRVVGLQRRGKVPSWEASMSELYRKDINPRFGRLMFEMFGREALIEGSDPRALLDGRPEWLLREGFNNHGQGGRFVTLNTIAKRGLGLKAR
jgi:alkylation response protein AidB-like acyl-CoA dehydrogenase